jgi:hypothetical protein
VGLLSKHQTLDLTQARERLGYEPRVPLEDGIQAFAAWWKQVGEARYPAARALFITADAGGSNGHRPRVWNAELQRLADNLDYIERGKPHRSEIYRLVNDGEMPPDDHPKTPPLTGELVTHCDSAVP